MTHGFKPLIFTAREDLVAGPAREIELAAQLGHLLGLEQAGDEPQALVLLVTP